jgi:rRNA small subunit pseudouridine methyltransferase Nep1
MLHVVIAEAEVELVPAKIARHPVIKKEAARRRKKPEAMLLDSSVHHAAMRSLTDGKRRGRPDIAHYTLLALLESPLNKQGMLRCYLHTRNDEVIFINPETRLPRACQRFRGLMEKLFAEGKITSGEVMLLEMKRMGIAQLVRNIGSEHVVLLSEDGREAEPWELAAKLVSKRNPCVIIGGFPSGGFRGDYSFAHERISIFPSPLAAWSVAAEVVSSYRRCIADAKTQP